MSVYRNLLQKIEDKFIEDESFTLAGDIKTHIDISTYFCMEDTENQYHEINLSNSVDALIASIDELDIEYEVKSLLLLSIVKNSKIELGVNEIINNLVEIQDELEGDSIQVYFSDNKIVSSVIDDIGSWSKRKIKKYTKKLNEYLNEYFEENFAEDDED